MEPALGVVILWFVFGGTHVGLATQGLRHFLVAKLGERGFLALFSLVAAASFAALITYYAAHRLEGAPGLALGRVAGVRELLIAVIGAGMVLVSATLVSYPRSPYALFAGRALREPYGIERVTRHPFFAGVALLGAAHALLATELVGAVFMGGFALLAVAGARHQDAKLVASRGRAHAEFVAVTSFLPFAAILAGRQRLRARELPIAPLALGLALAWWLRSVHAAIFDRGGLYVVATALAGAAIASFDSWRQARQRAQRAAEGPPVSSAIT